MKNIQKKLLIVKEALSIGSVKAISFFFCLELDGYDVHSTSIEAVEDALGVAVYYELLEKDTISNDDIELDEDRM